MRSMRRRSQPPSRAGYATVSEGLLGASKEIEAARQDEEFKRLQAYSKAYNGPRSTETEYTIMLIVEDVGRCSLDRFFLEEGIDMEYSEQEGLVDLLKPLALLSRIRNEQALQALGPEATQKHQGRCGEPTLRGGDH